MLAYPDRQDIVQALTQGNVAVLSQIALDVLTCPDDNLHFKQAMGLSYAGNCGYGSFPVNSGIMTEGDYNSGTPTFHNAFDIDWDQSGGPISARDADIARDTGVFWRSPISTDRFRMTTDRISNRDGTSNTLLIAENLNSQNWGGLSAGAGAYATYGYPTGGNGNLTTVLDTGFIMNITPTTGDVALTPGTLNPASAAVLTTSKMNSNKGKAPGNYAVPSSLHPGIVVTLFCDGRAKAIADNVDSYVYMRLVTSGGTRWRQAPLSDADY